MKKSRDFYGKKLKKMVVTDIIIMDDYREDARVCCICLKEN